MTYGFLGIYYVWYFLMLCKNLRMIMELDKSTIVMFCFS